MALLPPGGHTLTPDSPIGHPPAPTWVHKTEAERVARRYQETGAPVVITYPGDVLGPHDPHLRDRLQRLRNILKGRYPIAPSGGYRIVDLRDVAAVHAAVLEPGRGPAATWPAAPSWGSPSWWRSWGAVTGRRLRAVTVPAGLLLPAGRAVQLLQHIVPVHIRVEFEGRYFYRCAARSNDRRIRTELGVAARDIKVTLADSVRWLVEQGHISRRQAGQLATG